ncbi:MAG: DUF4037 domain-containing protein [Oscillospiraceae bacterium]|nr:DUF4037 domain-containing protein [Oscillospiraceae bacterium]
MKGLDEARLFYEQKGREMICTQFPAYEGRIAVGLAGRGSQCFGYDDALSRDHDFESGFCLWLTDGDDLAIGPALARAYRSLGAEGPKERSALGESGVGVRRIGDFYRRCTGSPGAPESWEHWMSIPSWALAEATNGEVWRDDLGEFSAIRETLLHGMPEDVRKKKLAARVIGMAQSGQYNYVRCLRHGEAGAAMLALSQFVRDAAETVFLLNRRHMPYYKWCFRALRALPLLSDMADPLEFLLTGENGAEGDALKSQLVEDVCASVLRELAAQGLCRGGADYLEGPAFEIQRGIETDAIRAMHIMEG